MKRFLQNYDLMYLDIQMEIVEGITSARSIRKMDDKFLLIYVSGYDKYMMEKLINY